MRYTPWLGGLALLCCAAAQAQEPLALEIGRIKTLQGQATVQTDTQTVNAAVGTPVYARSVVQTDKGSSLGLSFRDGTLVSLGSQTRFSVDEYRYDPNTAQYRFGATLLKGALSYLSGLIAKSRPEGVSVTTPTGVIGVRGTHFAAKVEEEVQP